MRCLRRCTPYGPHQGSRKRQHHPRPRPSQSTPQPRQTLRATSPAPTLCQSWEAILGRRPKTRGHAPRNRRRSHAKLCEHRLLRRLCASLGRLSILGRRPRTPRSTRVNALSDADRGVMGTISKYSDATIGDHVEALLGWFIYMSSRPGFEFEERVHDTIDMLNQAFFSAWVLGTFFPSDR